MITPQEISEKAFVKAVFGGYDMTGVDDFLEAVGSDYAALYKENAILKGKLKVLVEKVEEYRSTEDAMRMALLAAQRTGDEIMTEATRTKDEMLLSADMEARTMISDMSKRIAEEELRLSVAAKETAKFIEISQMILRKHSEFLSKLETARRVVNTNAPAEEETPPAPRPTREERIANTAGLIDSALEKLTNVSAQTAAALSEHVPLADPVAAPAPAAIVTPVAMPVAVVVPEPVPAAVVVPEPIPAAVPVAMQAAPIVEPAAATVYAAPAAVPAPAPAPVPVAAPVPVVVPAPVAAIVSEADEAVDPVYDDEGQPTKPYNIKSDEDDEFVTPRPKFDFDDLKFGVNFTNGD